MTIVPPLTREQCKVIVEHYEYCAAEVIAARERHFQAMRAKPLLSADAHRAHLVSVESAALFAEQQAAIAQLLALQALDRLDIIKQDLGLA